MVKNTNHNLKWAWLTKVGKFLFARCKILAEFMLIGVLVIIFIDFYVSYAVRDRIFTQVTDLPHRTYGLVLGTAKYYPNKKPNLYYQYRIEAAEQLFKQQKVDYLLLSGDNRTPYYNEPKMMKNDLAKLNIPDRFLFQDFAGFRTLDSVIRADKVFHTKSLTIISQQFHCERALFIAKRHNIDAICFVAKYPEGSFRVRIREFFARFVMIIDLLLGSEPEILVATEAISLPVLKK